MFLRDEIFVPHHIVPTALVAMERRRAAVSRNQETSMTIRAL